MRFKDISDCFRFVKEAEVEELEKVVNNNFYLYEHIANREEVKVSSHILQECQQKLKGTKCENEFWSDVLGFIDNESITDEVFNYFIENDVAIVALSNIKKKTV